jgi:cytochrome b6-f complex iron-sulfur subunit
MERKEFLSLIGYSGALFAACLAGCSKSAGGFTAPPPTNVDMNIDLTLPANANLTTAGGFIYTDGIIVAKTTAGTYIAISQACTHQGVSVQYQGNPQRFYCPSHGATFSNTGAVINSLASSPLTKYNTSISGNILRVYS